MIDAQQFDVQYVINQADEKTEVILPLGEFTNLLEDREDLAAIAEKRNEPTITHDALLAELKRDGLIAQ